MGLSPSWARSRCGTCAPSPPLSAPSSYAPTSTTIFTGPERRPKLPNPDPDNFVIKRTEQVGDHLVALVNYPDCTNYEGNKVLLFLHTTVKQLAKLKKLDPHFCDDNHLSPFARFVPTPAGFDAAVRTAKKLG